MRLYLLILLLFSLPAWAARSSVEVTKEIPVYSAPKSGIQVSFYIHRGESVSFAVGAEEDEFYHVWVKRSGKWKAGFVEKWSLDEAILDLNTLRTWGIGGGVSELSYNQGGRSFQTEDQVQYSTTNYKSSTLTEFAVFQWGADNFWRLIGAFQPTHYETTASTNLIGAQSKAVVLEQKFFTGMIQKAWNPFSWKPFYFGLGVEAAKATAVKLTMSGIEVPTTSEDQPIYFGGSGMLGLQFFLSQRWSIFGEGRYGVIVNQSPTIMSLEFAGGLLYWP